MSDDEFLKLKSEINDFYLDSRSLNEDLTCFVDEIRNLKSECLALEADCERYL